ncbi:RusA family crossover junction endodeoxyribonuclease [Pantoea ananatis]|uniref:RusA family crossover junction endodeoxyribonuclease n=1 Tax=Pantoea ananas TaxID=553 RepID=UPI003CEFB50A
MQSELRHPYVAQRRPQNNTIYVEATTSLYPSDKSNRDPANYENALLDSFKQAGVWVDDRQIKRLSRVGKEDLAEKAEIPMKSYKVAGNEFL